MRRFDIIIILFLIACGIFQYFSIQTIEDYGSDSSYYIELARSILERGKYEFNFVPHTLYPPGFSLVLAGIGWLTGRLDYQAFIRAMPLFCAAGLVVWYLALRRVAGRGVAAVACVLASTSAPFFRLATRTVNSDLLYFAVSGVAILCLLAIVRDGIPEGLPAWRRFLPRVGLCLATVAAVTVRSAGVALCAGLIVWVVVELWRRRRDAAVWSALAASMLGVLAAASWILWTSNARQLDYEGQHMTTYSNQFLTKDPHRPELGLASPVYAAARAVGNVPIQASHIASLLTGMPYILPVMYSPIIIVILVILICGFISYISNREQAVCAWYFLVYFWMFVLWPFDEGPRFMIPVAPLAFVLVFRGMSVIVNFFREKPLAALGAAVVLSGILLPLAMASGDQGMQARAARLFWPAVVVGAIAAFVLLRRPGTSASLRRFATSIPRAVLVGAGIALVACFALIGLSQQTAVARENLSPDPAVFRHHASVDFAEWLRAAAPGPVMAQQVAVIHRLSGRRAVALPISSDPRLIAGAISRSGVKYVMIADDRPFEYFFPTEQERWRILDAAYPGRFKVVHRGPGYRVLEPQ